jgi:two-component system, OmpR family, sensor histidine kinase BaeS
MRLLVTSILITLCSIAAAAWLAATATTEAIRQQQQPALVLADDATVYSTLLGYAATHRHWAGVQAQVRDLAARSGHQITLTTAGRRQIAASGPRTGPLPAQASARINPLQVDESLAADQGAGGIDARVVGPFLLTRQEREQLFGYALKALGCLRYEGYGATLSTGPSGRPAIEITGADPNPGWFLSCDVPHLDQPTATEQRALTQLSTMVNACLAPEHQYVQLNLDFSWLASKEPAAPSSQPMSGAGDGITPADQLIQTCIDAGRREQLRPYVAPPALLFITGPAAPATAAHLDLSPAGRARVVEVAALVLVLTVAVTIFVSGRLIRPLSTLTAAVQDPAPHVRVPVTSGDEIGRLTAAFNDFSERRERMEAQRTAMVSDIAHELRTPLANIRGWLEAAEDGLASSDQAFMASLLEEAVLLQHIIDDLQDLSAADAGQLRLHPEPVRVRDLLDQVATAHLSRADAAGITLDVATVGEPELSVDPVRLRQAVGNLVSNALRHTAAGGSVTIGCRPDAGQVVIEVADTGSGIAPDDLPKVFDRFWRAEKSRSRRTGGSGLGLPITRQLIEAHGGTVTATSVPGRRTVFTIRLPSAAPTGWPGADGGPAAGYRG